MSQFVSVDIEADGAIPGKFSMVSFGAVIVEPGLTKTFYSELKPISEEWNPEALAVSGFSREKCMTFNDPKEELLRFEQWLKDNCKGRPIFVADNNGFDFAWINWYFHYFLNRNPFGFSSRRLSDIICGFENDMFFKWKWMRKTKHDHNALSDAKGNAEVLLQYKDKGLNIKF